MSFYTLFRGYVGAKASYSSKITAFFTSGKVRYVEPFAGGGSIFFGMSNEKFEKTLLNDVNPNLAVLYGALADAELRPLVLEALSEIEKPVEKSEGSKLIKMCRDKMLRSRVGRVDKFLEKCSAQDVVDICRNTYALYSMSFNNNGKSFSSVPTPARYQNYVRLSLPKVAEAFERKTVVCNTDALKIVRHYKEFEEVQMYLDPPYVGMYRKAGASIYENEFYSLAEHIRLLTEINDSKAAVVLSGYRPVDDRVPCIYDAYLDGEKGWHCFQIGKSPRKCEVIKVGAKRNPAVEYIWTNMVPENAKYFVDVTDDAMEDITVKEYWNKIMEMVEQGYFTEKVAAEYVETYKKEMEEK